MRTFRGLLPLVAAVSLFAAGEIAIMTYDPGHFHAALLLKEMTFRPEVYVVVNEAARRDQVASALRRRVKMLSAAWPGIELHEQGGRFHVTIPEQHRIGHEAHFAKLTGRFFEYVRSPRTLPAWEAPFMLAKYYVTTEGVALARRNLK